MNYSVSKAQTIGDRAEQQDAYGLSHLKDEKFNQHGGYAAVVADGVGGGHSGKEAARIAVETFLAAYQAKPPSEAITFALERSLKLANDAVFAFGQKAGHEGMCCSTLVAAVVHGATVHWISAGDSRAYLLRGGKLYRLTSDHTVGTSLTEDVANGLIPAEMETPERPDLDELTSYVGKPEPPHSDGNYQPYPLAAGDKIVLCTDGVYRTLSEDELAETLASDSRTGCERVIQIVESRHVPHQDNATILMLGHKSGFHVPANIGLIALLAILLSGPNIVGNIYDPSVDGDRDQDFSYPKLTILDLQAIGR